MECSGRDHGEGHWENTEDGSSGDVYLCPMEDVWSVPVVVVPCRALSCPRVPVPHAMEDQTVPVVVVPCRVCGRGKLVL